MRQWISAALWKPVEFLLRAPFTWTKGPEHLQRIIETTKDYQALHPKKPRRRHAKWKKPIL